MDGSAFASRSSRFTRQAPNSWSRCRGDGSHFHKFASKGGALDRGVNGFAECISREKTCCIELHCKCGQRVRSMCRLMRRGFVICAETGTVTQKHKLSEVILVLLTRLCIRHAQKQRIYSDRRADCGIENACVARCRALHSLDAASGDGAMSFHKVSAG